MPKISLVVCLYKERELLERLLHHAKGCFDDLVVIHDGPEGGETSAQRPDLPRPELALDWSTIPADAPLPDIFANTQTPEQPGSLREYIRLQSGKFIEHPRIGSLEGQSPFAWWAAKHDWILRLDADEFPSDDLKEWIQHFRQENEPDETLSGYTCIWPLWNGREAVSDTWPAGRLFLFHRDRVRFFGLVEQTPVADGYFENIDLILHHQPRRKSYGIRNIMFRQQAYRWRKIIATSLLQSPLSLPRWRHTTPTWPAGWQAMVDEPLAEGVYRLWKFPLQQARALRAHNLAISPGICLNPAIHHFLICMQLWKLRGFPRPRIPLRRIVKKILLGSTFAAISSRRKGLQTLGGICPWTLDTSLINRTSKVISGGVGGDISFELELSGRTGCKIVLFDPSPTGKATMSSLEPLPDCMKFYPMALAADKGGRKFAAPLDADEGSFREPDSTGNAEFEWPSTGVQEFLDENGWDVLDLLKLDIEGFEFEVLDALLRSRLRPRQLLVEFHYGREATHSFWAYYRMLLRLRMAGYKLVARKQGDHSFLWNANTSSP